MCEYQVQKHRLKHNGNTMFSPCSAQITALEKSGGTILGGALKLMQDKKKNPGPPRDPSLPPKPKGQTVGTFTGGLKMLPEAIARKMHDKLRSA